MTRAQAPVTLRCPFCLTLNKLDLAKAVDRPRCGRCQKPMLLDRPIKVEQDDFDASVKGAGPPVLVDFYADWCSPCKLVAPLVDELAREHTGRLLVAKVDTDRAPELSLELQIRGVPTLILFHEGREVDRSVGFDPDGIRAMVERAVA